MTRNLLKNSKIKNFLFLHLILLIYALVSMVSKIASQQVFLSMRFLILYSSVVFLMAVYAVLWQQVLKRIPLSTAFANKGIVIVWSMLIGAVAFKEEITFRMVIGGIIIIIGIVMISLDNTNTH